MVDNFLNELSEENRTKEENLKKEIKSLHLILKENAEFIKLLESEEDDTYEVFSPRKAHPGNRDRINSLKTESEEIKNKIEIRQEQLDELKERQESLQEVITEFHKTSEKAALYDEKCELEKRRHEDEMECNFEEKKTAHRDECEYGYASESLVECNKNFEGSISEENTRRNLNNALHGLELCSKIVDVDPVRCKLEISSVMKIIADVISKDDCNGAE